MIGENEYLERIVAGIHAVTTSDAEVSWNEVINGRQFDVVVRFILGTLRYLVLIEVKNKTRAPRRRIWTPSSLRRGTRIRTRRCS